MKSTEKQLKKELDAIQDEMIANSIMIGGKQMVVKGPSYLKLVQRRDYLVKILRRND